LGLFSSFDISASGLTANREWMDVIASNIANAETTRTPEGGVYKRKDVVFETYISSDDPDLSRGQGVRVGAIVEDPTPPRLVFNPGHPDARPDGYVEMPNVSPVTEMVDMMVATRAYEANATAIDSAKAMIGRVIDLLR
jgi:flagellar basal-body rod protein FlgC